MYEQPKGYGIRIGDTVRLANGRSKKHGSVLKIDYVTADVHVLWDEGSRLDGHQRIDDLVVLGKYEYPA